jgi:hypothetical protein
MLPGSEGAREGEGRGEEKEEEKERAISSGVREQPSAPVYRRVTDYI